MPILVRYVLRLALAWVINTAALIVLAAIVPGFDIDRFWEAAGLAVVIALLTATLRPLLVWATLRFIVYSGGLLGLVISALVVVVGADLVEGVRIANIGSGILVVLGLGLVNTVAQAILPLDDDLSYFRGVARREGKRHLSEHMSDEPGVVFFEIDGLAEDVLRRAIEAGHAPTMARWMRQGSHVLTPWECDLSSQTGASQAGLLHGDNSDMPGFRWYVKETGVTVVSNHPDDAAANEARFPPGQGLLAGGGSAIGNMFSGEAEQSLFTMSRIADSYRERVPAIYAYFADPQNYARALYLSIHDIWLEWRAARRQRRRDERPRVERGGTYPFVRAATTVALRELGVYSTIAEMYRGVPVMYATYVGYDEVAHHSGPERPDALAVLGRLDKQLARLEKAAEGAPRPYRLVVLSDHGQSLGTPFRQLHDETLEDLIARVMSAAGPVRAGSSADEGVGALNVALKDAADTGGASGAVATRALRGKLLDGQAESGPPSPPEPTSEEDAGAIVLVSGGLALVYFPDVPGRATYEEIELRAPGLIDALAGRRGIGFVMLRSSQRGAIVMGASGHRRLDDDAVEGNDPLAPYGATAADHLRRTDGFGNCPDILVNGAFDPATGELNAFEEFAGSHGCLGGAQMHPFLLHPVELPAPDEPLVGAERVHALLKTWRP